MAETIPYRFKLRGGTRGEWASANPVLLSREPGVETDTGGYKFGDGVRAWNDLPYSGRNIATVLAEADKAASDRIVAENLPSIRTRLDNIEAGGTGGTGGTYDDSQLRTDFAEADKIILRDAKLYADGKDNTLSGRLDSLESRPKNVVLSQAEYDSLATKDANTLYFIRS